MKVIARTLAAPTILTGVVAVLPYASEGRRDVLKRTPPIRQGVGQGSRPCVKRTWTGEFLNG